MKTSIIAIALAAIALASVDALKCEKYASGTLASWEEVNLENGHVQHYAMKDGKLAKSHKGEEFDFYACEAPAKFHKNIKANRDHGAEKAGVIKTKDGKKCLTNSFIRVRDPSTDDKYHTGYKQVPENVGKEGDAGRLCGGRNESPQAVVCDSFAASGGMFESTFADGL